MINNEEILKSASRRTFGIISNELSGGDIINYGEEADAKLLSWQQLKSINEITKKIVSSLEIMRDKSGQDLTLQLISEAYHDLIELNEILRVRTEIVKKIEIIGDIDEEYRFVFADTYDLDLLRGINEVLERFEMSNIPSVLDNILGLAENCIFYSIHVEGIIKYHKTKNECKFSNVVRFLDDNFYKFYDNDAMGYITDILNEYSESRINLPFSEELQRILEWMITFLKGTDVFENKNEKTLIKLINGIFIWLYSVPQLEEQSFELIAEITPLELPKENKLRILK